MKLETTLNKDKQQWWNRPLWGEKSLWDRLNEPVSNLVDNKEILSLHNQALIQAILLAETISKQDREEFSHPEFIKFLKIRNKVNKEIDEYEYLLNSIRLVTVSLQLKDIFISLGEVENRYQGFQEQGFYDFINSLIEKNLTRDEFLAVINNRFPYYTSLLSNPNIENALKSYKKGIEILAVNSLGLKILGNLKKHQINYVIFLNKLHEIINNLIQKNHLENLNFLEAFISKNSSFFKQLNKIIELSETLNNDTNQALIIQFVGLSYKYKSDYVEFKDFLTLLSQWEKTYQTINNIRAECADISKNFGKKFEQEIPGLEIYEKYHNLLA
jgi:hypothetical protein